MPEKTTVEKAKRDLKQGKSASTAAGEFVREEIEHIREGKHGARSAKQAIAIGLSKARRAGVPLPVPEPGQTSARTRRAAQRETEIGQGIRKPRPTSKKQRRAAAEALQREPHAAASKTALSRHAKAVARRRAKAASSTTARSPARRGKRTATKRTATKRTAKRAASSTTARAPGRRGTRSATKRAAQRAAPSRARPSQAGARAR